MSPVPSGVGCCDDGGSSGPCIPDGEVQFEPRAASFFTDIYPFLNGFDEEPSSQAWLNQGTCPAMGVMYSCMTDMVVLWSPDFTFFLPGGMNPPRPATVDLVTDTGEHDSIGITQHSTDDFTYSSAIIQNASQYGNRIISMTFRDDNGDFICQMLEPYGSWNGAPWAIGDAFCGVTPPADDLDVEYDTGTNELVITSPNGIFTSNFAYLVIAMDSNENTIPITNDGNGYIVVVSPNEIRITNSSGYGNVAVSVEAFNASDVVIGEWDGSVIATNTPFVHGIDRGVSDGELYLFGEQFLSAPAGPIASMNISFLDGGAVQFYPTTGPNAGSNPPGTTGFTIPDPPDSDTVISIANVDQLGGRVIVSVQLQGEDGMWVSTFYPQMGLGIAPLAANVGGSSVRWGTADGSPLNCETFGVPGKEASLILSLNGEMFDDPNFNGVRVTVADASNVETTHDIMFSEGFNIIEFNPFTMSIVLGDTPSWMVSRRFRGSQALRSGVPSGTSSTGAYHQLTGVSDISITGDRMRIEYAEPPLSQAGQHKRVTWCDGLNTATYNTTSPDMTVYENSSTAFEFSVAGRDPLDAKLVTLVDVSSTVSYMASSEQWT